MSEIWDRFINILCCSTGSRWDTRFSSSNTFLTCGPTLCSPRRWRQGFTKHRRNREPLPNSPACILNDVIHSGRPGAHHPRGRHVRELHATRQVSPILEMGEHVVGLQPDVPRGLSVGSGASSRKPSWRRVRCPQSFATANADRLRGRLGYRANPFRDLRGAPWPRDSLRHHRRHRCSAGNTRASARRTAQRRELKSSFSRAGWCFGDGSRRCDHCPGRTSEGSNFGGRQLATTTQQLLSCDLACRVLRIHGSYAELFVRLWSGHCAASGGSRKFALPGCVFGMAGGTCRWIPSECRIFRVSVITQPQLVCISSAFPRYALVVSHGHPLDGRVRSVWHEHNIPRASGNLRRVGTLPDIYDHNRDTIRRPHRRMEKSSSAS